MIIQTVLAVVTLLNLCVSLNGDDPCQQKLSSEKVGLVTINNQNDHEIKLIAPPEPDPFDCTKCTDPKILKERMRLVPQARLLDNLVRFDSRTRMEYLRILSRKDAKQLLQDIEKFNGDEKKRLSEAPGADTFLKELRTKAKGKEWTWVDVFIVYAEFSKGFSPHNGRYWL